MAMTKKNNSYFAPAERSDENKIRFEFDMIQQDPVISGLLHSISGLLAVLDSNRQVVAVNDSFIRTLGIENAMDAIGLRPGEVIKCIYSDLESGGCGTSKYCATCGAAISIVSCLDKGKSMEKICALKAVRSGKSIDIALQVRAHPIDIDSSRFILLFLQDITLQQQRAALERTFFHDLNNIISSLIGASELLLDDYKNDKLTNIIYQSSIRIKKEVDIQRSLFEEDSHQYTPFFQTIHVDQLFRELKELFQTASDLKQMGIHLEFNRDSIDSEYRFRSDISLVCRVLTNMIKNAIEASKPNGKVVVSVFNRGENKGDKKNARTVFSVWNATAIPEKIALRVFQRNFSTKSGEGRGIGTYSMKLFGENILGGEVSFTSSEENGTTFLFSIPKS